MRLHSIQACASGRGWKPELRHLAPLRVLLWHGWVQIRSHCGWPLDWRSQCQISVYGRFRWCVWIIGRWWMVFPLVPAHQLSSRQLFGNRGDGWSVASRGGPHERKRRRVIVTGRGGDHPWNVDLALQGMAPPLLFFRLTQTSGLPSDRSLSGGRIDCTLCGGR